MVSVVIPAYNEEKLIGKCLESLVNQNFNEKFEVILVDNNSTDKTEEIAQTFSRELNLRIVREKQKGRGAARRRGFSEAKGDIILSTDADTIVPSNWIQNLVESLKSSNAVGVTGSSKIKDCDLLTNISFNFLQPVLMKAYSIVFGHYWLSGFSFAIYRNAYEDSGGFNSELNVQEDTDLAFRVSKIGKIKFATDIPVIFSGRRYRKGLLIGLIPYLTTFANNFLFKKPDQVLSDIR